MAPEALRSLLARLTGLSPGKRGEELACRHLAEEGLRVLARNVRYRSGEIDVVARDEGEIVFVEVKERTGPGHGAGHEAVTMGKRRRLVRAAMLYASAHGLLDSPLRFDVVSVDWGAEGPRIRHDRGAFDADGR